MIEDKIQNCLIRYLNNSSSTFDLDILEDWIKDPSHHLIFKEYIKTHFAITIGMSNPDPSEIRKRLLSEIRKNKSLFYRKKFNSLLKYAAIAILFVGMGYFFKEGNAKFSSEEIIVQDDDKITLELENGEKVIISEDGISEIVNSKGEIVGKQEGKKLVYDNGVASETIRYNTLKVPYGKRFDIVLSDGSRIFLNAGSSIRYPIKFLKEFERKVFLEGEAFFEVSHNEEQSFIVEAQELKVKVYGTKFNLSNYPEDSYTEVVLTDGSVGLWYDSYTSEKEDDTILTPGFKGAFDRSKKTISTKKVNTSLYTSWIDGDIVFRNTPFEKILQRLERQYNVVIVNNNEKLANETFNATIETDRESIEQVFDYFDKVYDIEYRVINNKIIID